MSVAANCCVNCGTPVTVNVPGTAGLSAYTLLSTAFVVPALGGAVTIEVVSSEWAAVGETVFVPGGGWFTVTAVPDSTHISLTYQNIAQNVNAGAAIAAGVLVTPSAVATDGTDGINATTTVTADFVIPAIGAAVSNPDGFIHVASTAAMTAGLTIFVSDGTDWGAFTVDSVSSATAIVATFLGHTGDSAPGQTIGTGASVVPTGTQPPLSGALPAALTDNTTGTPGAALAVGTGQFTHSIYFRAAAITGNVLLYTYTPGFAFKIVRISASVVDAITTAARAATLTTAIAGTPTTGGVVVMSGTYALGAEQASSAAITALNTGTSVQAITVTASSVTAFAEGGFMLHFQIQNSDSANSIASINSSVDDLITALT